MYDHWVGEENYLCTFIENYFSVGAVLQTNSGGETEQVSRMMVDMDKVKVLVEHIITLESWRHHLLPRLLKLSTPVSSFPVYSVVFQEACCLSLLETGMFHVDVAQSLEDAGPDLLDYCMRNITHLLYPIDDEIKHYSLDNQDQRFVMQELLDQVFM